MGDALTIAVVGFLSAITGAAIRPVLTGSIQHRQWLRTSRHEAYARVLVAYDTVVEAADDYISAARFALDELNDDERAQFATALDKRWHAYKEADAVWRERVTAAVLVSTRLAEMGLALMTLRSTPAPLMLAAEGDDGREWQLEQCRQW